MDTKDTRTSLLTIKVLRLLRPSLIGPLALTCDSRDLPKDLWEKELKQDVTSQPDLSLLSLGEFLRLPQGFGNMYLGETFSSYICIHNESQTKVINISAKIELQTNSQKFVLADRKNHSVLNPDETIDILMHHEIKEMGKHMLICNLTYTISNPQGVPQGEPIFLERYFKFQVKKPLDVKTKLYNSETDEVFLEAQVQNLTQTPIFMEKVDLEPSQHFTCTALGNPNEKFKTPESTIFTTNRLLDVDCSQQYLYRLKPKVITFKTSPNNIGKLDIVWRSTMGDRGRLQTSQLQRQTPVWNDIRINFENLPEMVIIHEPFKASCKINNTTSDQDMDLILELDDRSNESFCFAGLTKTKLGILEATKSLVIDLTLMPLKMGIISITGIKLTDLKKGGKYQFNEIAQVFVLANSYSEE